jgi:hypothetical protein
MMVLHCRVNVDSKADGLEIPKEVPVICVLMHEADTQLNLPNAELERDGAGVWATFWLPKEFGVTENDQVEVTARLIAARKPEYSFPWTIGAVEVRRIW